MTNLITSTNVTNSHKSLLKVIKKNVRTSYPFTVRKYLLLFFLVFTTIELKDILKLNVKDVKQLEKEGVLQIPRDRFCKSFSKTLEFIIEFEKKDFEDVFQAWYKNRTDEDYVFTTIYDLTRPVYPSNVKKEISLLILNLTAENNNDYDLTKANEKLR